MQDIHDIRPPVRVGIDPVLIQWILMGLGLFLIAAVAFVLIRRWIKKRAQKKQPDLLPEPLAPYEQAIRSLARLAEKPIDPSRIFYFDLTLILRKYMGRTFDTPAVEMTSQQFLKHIRKMALDERIKIQVIDFYKACDPYKYAGDSADTDQIRQDLKTVKQIIDQVQDFTRADEPEKGDTD